jgi:hypothetical protein
MAFIPEQARWYIADVVLEHAIEDDPRNVVHINILLVEASSPEDAFAQALELGRSHEMEYLNTDGKQVTVRFRGLRALNVIHDELEHGAELLYEEEVGVPESRIRGWVREKSELNVFRPSEEEDTDRPNYMPASVWQDVLDRLAKQEGEQEEEP